MSGQGRPVRPVEEERLRHRVVKTATERESTDLEQDAKLELSLKKRNFFTDGRREGGSCLMNDGRYGVVQDNICVIVRKAPRLVDEIAYLSSWLQGSRRVF